MKSGKKSVVIKPAAYVLLGAVLIGIVVPIYWMNRAANHQLVWEHLNLDIWKFEVRRGAIAQIRTLQDETSTVPKTGELASYKLDLQKGVEIDIQRTDGKPDSADLRTAIDFEGIRERDDLYVQFSARSDRPHEIALIVRELGTVRWSSKQVAGQDWKDFRVPLSLKACTTYQAVFSLHLGGTQGKLLLKNLRISN